jgi:hypothetical protein
VLSGKLSQKNCLILSLGEGKKSIALYPKKELVDQMQLPGRFCFEVTPSEKELIR